MQLAGAWKEFDTRKKKATQNLRKEKAKIDEYKQNSEEISVAVCSQSPRACCSVR